MVHYVQNHLHCQRHQHGSGRTIEISVRKYELVSPNAIDLLALFAFVITSTAATAAISTQTERGVVFYVVFFWWLTLVLLALWSLNPDIHADTPNWGTLTFLTLVLLFALVCIRSTIVTSDLSLLVICVSTGAMLIYVLHDAAAVVYLSGLSNRSTSEGAREVRVPVHWLGFRLALHVLNVPLLFLIRATNPLSPATPTVQTSHVPMHVESRTLDSLLYADLTNTVILNHIDFSNKRHQLL
jgi:hypothetical protein